MSLGVLILIVLAISALGYVLGRRWSLTLTNGDIRKLHSLPSYYGQSVFIFSAVPAFGLLLLWMLIT